MCALPTCCMFKMIIMSNTHSICLLKSSLSPGKLAHKSPEMNPNLRSVAGFSIACLSQCIQDHTGCFNYRNQFDLDTISALFHAHQRIKTFLVTSAKIFWNCSLICTSHVNIVPAGLFCRVSRFLRGWAAGYCTSLESTAQQLKWCHVISCQSLFF